MKYRADIDGLRAIAVLSVIFYHLGFTTIFGSGFTGVDIFFVISGYLITSIIYKEILEERFSFLDFYERRIRRIFPIFLTVVLSTLCFAYYINFYDMRNFLNSLFSTLVMGGNFYFWKDTDYFALPSHMKPLLHTWSLGVEEQFYIIFPFILIFLLSEKFSLLLTSPRGKKWELLYIFKKTPILVHLFILWLISFVICIMQSYATVDTAFYLLPYRFWELLSGSILAIATLQEKQHNILKERKIHLYFYTIKFYIVRAFSFSNSIKQANLFGVTGLLLIIFSVTLLEKLNQPFPSFLALFPCLGALLCIQAGKNEETFIYKLLSFSLLKNIGKISFSLYLWHWVVIVFARDVVLLDTADLTLKVAFSCLAISFALSIFSYFIIEQPIRKKIILKTRKSLFITVFALTAVIALLAFAVKKEIIPQHISEDVKYYNGINIETAYAGRKIPASLIKETRLHFFGDKNIEPTLLIMGDSHALALYVVLDKLAKEHNVAGILHHSGSGLFDVFKGTDNNNTKTKNILKNTELLKKYLSNYSIQSVFISCRWTRRIFGLGLAVHERSDKARNAVINQYINPHSHEVITDAILATKLGINDTINFFSKTKPKIFISKPLPEFAWQVPQRATKVVKFFPKTSSQFRELISIPHSLYLNHHRETFQVLEDIRKETDFEYIDLAKNICDGEYCYGTAPDGTAIYYDDDHLSIEGAELFRDEFLPFILAGKKED